LRRQRLSESDDAYCVLSVALQTLVVSSHRDACASPDGAKDEPAGEGLSRPIA
jgi:hypothetical protein